MYSNNIIIHNNNIPSIEQYDNSVKFLSIESTLKSLLDKEFETIYIKDNLSANCLDFLGLELAYHIRFADKLKYKTIVILSDLDGFTLSKLTSFAQILLTKNTFLNKEPQVLPLFNQDNYDSDFFNKISVERPKDTSSNHDISNEWAIYKWAQFLKAESDSITQNNQKVQEKLYFKYLKIKYPIPRKSGISFFPKSPKSEGKILYIDDEYKKGWSDIFEKYFSKSQGIHFYPLKHNYKDSSYEEIEKKVHNAIENSSIDMVLLDMRLREEDHEELDEGKLSGMRLLNYLKSLNPGIQVILLTASKNSTILDRANRHNILGYIKKESPEDEASYTKEIFKKIEFLIDRGLERKYLKEIWNIQEKILGLEGFKNNSYDEDKSLTHIRLQVESVFEIVQTYIENKFIYAMFTIYKVIEIIIDLYIDEKKDDNKRFAYWRGTNTKIKIVGKKEYFPKILQITSQKQNDSTLNKIRIILYEKLSLNDIDIHDSLIGLTELRNNTIHRPRNKKIKKPNEANIQDWFTMLAKILENMDLSLKGQNKSI